MPSHRTGPYLTIVMTALLMLVCGASAFAAQAANLDTAAMFKGVDPTWSGILNWQLWLNIIVFGILPIVLIICVIQAVNKLGQGDAWTQAPAALISVAVAIFIVVIVYGFIQYSATKAQGALIPPHLF